MYPRIHSAGICCSGGAGRGGTLSEGASWWPDSGGDVTFMAWFEADDQIENLLSSCTTWVATSRARNSPSDESGQVVIFGNIRNRLGATL